MQQEPNQPTVVEVRLPSLPSIRVRAVAPEPVTEDDIWLRLDEWLQAASFKREKKEGEAVAEDDVVTLDVAGYRDGELVPGTLMQGWDVRVAPASHLPGFFEAIATATVGDTLNLTIELSTDYPIEALRGESIDFTVAVKAAQQVRWGSLEDPVVLGRLNKGSNSDAVIDAAATELEEESMFDAQRQSEALVLDAVIGASKFDLDEALVEAEMMLMFASHEGRLLMEMGAEEDDQVEALASFLQNDEQRVEAATRIARNAVLNAIAVTNNLTPSLARVGIDIDEKTLAQNDLLEHARRQAALDFLVEKCVEFPN